MRGLYMPLQSNPQKEWLIPTGLGPAFQHANRARLLAIALRECRLPRISRDRLDVGFLPEEIRSKEQGRSRTYVDDMKTHSHGINAKGNWPRQTTGAANFT